MTAERLAETVERVSTLVAHYHRDAPFRAPETKAEWQSRLLNGVWAVLLDARDSDFRADGQKEEPGDA